MNPAKSKFTAITIKTFAVATEAQGDGKAVHRTWTGKYGGKDCPIAGDPTVDTISLTKINPNTIKCIVKKNGKEYYSGQAVVSNGQAFTYGISIDKQ
jgi:hypothetical protein